jgi:deoxyribonuclease V
VKQVDLEILAKLQERLASKLELKKDLRQVNLIGGADFGYDKEMKRIGAGIVILRFPGFEIVEISQAIRKVKFPYIPTFLSFREGPVFFDAFRKIKKKPDVTFVDGNGIAHPRKMGLASYVGVILDIATIGCAKNPMYPFLVPPEHRGAYTSLMNDTREKVGICLRTRTGVKPIFVSPGHRVDIASSMELVLRCSKFRIPEPLRTAHRLSREIFQKTKRAEFII